MSQLFNTVSGKEIMNKRSAIYGISALGVMLYHINKYVSFPIWGRFGVCLSWLFSFGNAGVDAFLFFSAISLCVSMSKNSTLTFYKNRLKRCVIPFLLCALPFYIWYDFIKENDGIVQYFLNISSLNCWLKGTAVYTFWYYSAIILFYIFFPVIFYISEKTHRYGILLIIALCIAFDFFCYYEHPHFFGTYEIFLSRAPVFFLGVYFSDFFLSERKFTNPGTIIIALGVPLSAVGYEYFQIIILRRFCAAAFVICSLIIIAMLLNRFNPNTRFLDFMGKISLESYLVHVALFQPIKHYDLWPLVSPIAWYLIIIGITIPVSYLISKASSLISK